MTRSKNALAALAALAFIVSPSAAAFAASDGKAQRSEKNCEVHKPVADDCHVHDERTFQHMRLQDRDRMSPHAQREMREFIRKEQEERRN